MKLCFSGLCRPCCRGRVLRDPRSKRGVCPDVGKPQQFQDIASRNLDCSMWNASRTANTYFRILRRMPMWREDFRHAYEEVARGPVPVLFVWGDSDNTVPWWEVGDELTRIFAPVGASCIMFKDTGHHCLLEYPEHLAQCSSDWFSDSQRPDWRKFLEDQRLRPRADLLLTGACAGNPGSGSAEV
jgi:pimeloyl-ACP methyl ester carboxylesterase